MRDPESTIGDLEAGSLGTVAFCLMVAAILVCLFGLVVWAIICDGCSRTTRRFRPIRSRPTAYEIPDAEYVRGAKTEDQT